MKVIVHPKTDDVRRRLDRYGDIYLLIQDGVFMGERAVQLQSLKLSECCGGRKYHYQGWFRASEAEWTFQKD
jgi:hypothetical protein